jgi:hypothetical protein
MRSAETSLEKTQGLCKKFVKSKSPGHFAGLLLTD